MNNSKILAYLLFLSSCVTAYCLGMLAYTYMTGELLYGITNPLLVAKEDKVKKPEEKVLKVEKSVRDGNISEGILIKLADEVMKEKAKISLAKEKLAVREKLIKEQLLLGEDLQKKINSKESVLKNLLTVIEKEELKNLKRISGLIQSMETQASIKMLEGLDRKVAIRVLYIMEDKDVSKILENLLQNPDKNEQKKGIKYMDDLRKITAINLGEKKQ